MRAQRSDNQEIRNVDLSVQNRVEIRKTAKGRMAVGYSIVFPPAISQNLGGFVEEIDHNAVNLSRNNVWAVRGHDVNAPLGNTNAGTLRLSKDARGIRHEIDLPDTTDGNDLVELLSRGDGGQCSFSFICLSDNWSERADGSILRTVTDLQLMEISIGVIFPAYTDTQSAIRSCPAAIRSKLLKRDTDNADDVEQTLHVAAILRRMALTD